METKKLSMLLGCVLLAACATAPAGSTTRPDGRVLTREQLVETNATSVYIAVQHLQPGWLTSRGPRSITDTSPSVASVFVNGSQVGDVTYLHQVRPDAVDEIRYYEAGEASARFGMGHPGGVINVIMRGQVR